MQIPSPRWLGVEGISHDTLSCCGRYSAPPPPTHTRRFTYCYFAVPLKWCFQKCVMFLFDPVITYMMVPTHARLKCFQLGQDTWRCAAEQFSNPPGEEEELSLLADKLSSRWEEIPGMVVGVTEQWPDTLSIRPSLTAPADQSSREIEGLSKQQRR